MTFLPITRFIPPTLPSIFVATATAAAAAAFPRDSRIWLISPCTNPSNALLRPRPGIREYERLPILASSTRQLVSAYEAVCNNSCKKQQTKTAVANHESTLSCSCRQSGRATLCNPSASLTLTLLGYLPPFFAPSCNNSPRLRHHFALALARISVQLCCSSRRSRAKLLPRL